LSTSYVKISPAETITDIDKFIESHEALLKGNASEKIKEPYRDRLKRYYDRNNTRG
tara:strand:- start:26108 stop:26275 length:168 start_codon:yes stop_codon:yes gene_type:complete